MTLNEKSLLKMYNSVIECVKVTNMFIGLKKDLFGLVWKVWLYRRHSKSNQLIKITMTITTVLHSRCSLLRFTYLRKWRYLNYFLLLFLDQWHHRHRMTCDTTQPPNGPFYPMYPIQPAWPLLSWYYFLRFDALHI